VALLLATFPPDTAVADGGMTTELLAAAIEQQLSSIISMEIEYKYIFEADELMVARHGDKKTTEREAKWAEQGNWCLLEQFLPGSPRRLIMAHTFDGEKGYHYDAPPRPNSTDKPPRLHISRQIGKAYRESTTPAYSIGRRLPYVDVSLSDVLRLPTAVLAKREVIDGRECYRVDVTGFSTAQGHALTLTTHLDPAHDYLPARVAMSYDSDEVPFERAHQVWDMADFMRVRDGANGGERWFPRVATLSQVHSTYTLRMTSVRINDALARDRFRVDAPEGTIVKDVTEATGTKRTVVGGPSAEQRIAARAADLAKAELSPQPAKTSVPVDARPRRRSLTPWMLGASLLALAISVVFWLRSR
jgi:hypothetical protein